MNVCNTINYIIAVGQNSCISISFYVMFNLNVISFIFFIYFVVSQCHAKVAYRSKIFTYNEMPKIILVKYKHFANENGNYMGCN